jgi:hypothetical protein
MRRIALHVKRGRRPDRERIRFTTWSLRYASCHWVKLLGLREHYERATIDARRTRAGEIEVSWVENITRFALHAEGWQGTPGAVKIGGQRAKVARNRKRANEAPVVFALRGDRWVQEDRSPRGLAKSPGLQGPIDDAFTSSFVCVRGTGRPWVPCVHTWAHARLDAFADTWARYQRGDLPLIDDAELTKDDLRTKHVILFGDPGSNRWIRKALPDLPIQWTRRSLVYGRQTYSPDDHIPLLIYPNPLPGGAGRYLVLNTGHTFTGKEFATINYLLFPRLGDWAVMPINSPPAEVGEPNATGFFDERWRFKR